MTRCNCGARFLDNADLLTVPHMASGLTEEHRRDVCWKPVRIKKEDQNG